MIYTPEEKRRMEKLLEAFDGYITDRGEFDVAYSERSGYVWLVTSEYGEQVYFPIADYDDMLDMFIDDAVVEAESQVLLLPGSFDPAKVDIHGACRLLNRIFETLEDRNYAQDRMDQYVENWKRKYEKDL